MPSRACTLPAPVLPPSCRCFACLCALDPALSPRRAIERAPPAPTALVLLQIFMPSGTTLRVKAEPLSPCKPYPRRMASPCQNRPRAVRAFGTARRGRARRLAARCQPEPGPFQLLHAAQHRAHPSAPATTFRAFTRPPSAAPLRVASNQVRGWARLLSFARSPCAAAGGVFTSKGTQSKAAPLRAPGRRAWPFCCRYLLK